jgi:hypothetical protein
MPCEPLWTGTIGRTEPSANVVDGLVVQDDLGALTVGHDVGGGDGGDLGSYLFRTECPSEACVPERAFQSRHVFPAAPVVWGHRLYVAEAGGRRVLAAFRTRCSHPEQRCARVWSARTRTGSFAPSGPYPLVTKKLVFIRSSSRGLSVLPTSCAGPDQCEPVREMHLEIARVSSPQLGPNRSLVLTSRYSTIVAFHRGCRGSCYPIWTWKAPDFIDNVVVAGHLVLVGTEDRIYVLRPPAAS